jgi:hypothetical protein
MRPVKIKKWKGQSWNYAHVKRDGMWITAKTQTASLQLWSRLPSLIEYDLDWCPDYQALGRLPPWSEVYCEAFVEGGNREDVKGAMRDRDPRLRIEAFAIGMWEGTPVPADEDLPSLEKALAECGVRFTPFFLVRRGQVPPKVSGSEGWVLKDGNLLNWYKVKDEDTWDLRVVSWRAGRGKYRGSLGSLLCVDAQGVEVAVSGMEDWQRDAWARDFGLVRGRIVEVEAQGVGSAGGLYHPRFVRIRDDKTEPDLIAGDR